MLGLLFFHNFIDFNSRTHVECDQVGKNQSLYIIDFNSRTHVECDTAQFTRLQKSTISTHALTWSAT